MDDLSTPKRKPTSPIRVFLIGFMGSGKTTVGQRLALRLGATFVDLDAEIVAHTQRSIPEIFEQEGEPAFRHLETHVLATLCTRMDTPSSSPHWVISLGGGAFIPETNRTLIHRHGVSIWLDAPFETLALRLQGDADRPLFRDVEKARRLDHDRRPCYALATARFDTGQSAPDDIVEQIVAWLGRDR